MLEKWEQGALMTSKTRRGLVGERDASMKNVRRLDTMLAKFTAVREQEIAKQEAIAEIFRRCSVWNLPNFLPLLSDDAATGWLPYSHIPLFQPPQRVYDYDGHPVDMTDTKTLRDELEAVGRALAPVGVDINLTGVTRFLSATTRPQARFESLRMLVSQSLSKNTNFYRVSRGYYTYIGLD